MHSIAIGGTLFLVAVYFSPVPGAGPFGTQEMANDRPDDLKIVGTSGGLLPGSVNYVVEIGADGHGRYSRYRPEDLGPPLADASFVIRRADLDTLWCEIERVDFFSLETRYEAADVDDGVFASITVTANAKTHHVEVRNVSVPRFQKLLAIINRSTPEGMDLVYAID